MSFKAIVLKLQHASESSGGLWEIQVVGPNSRLSGSASPEGKLEAFHFSTILQQVLVEYILRTMQEKKG
jgi:hypothetical protein